MSRTCPILNLKFVNVDWRTSKPPACAPPPPQPEAQQSPPQQQSKVIYRDQKAEEVELPDRPGVKLRRTVIDEVIVDEKPKE